MCSIFRIIYRLSKERQTLYFTMMDGVVLESKLQKDKNKV